MKDKFFKLLDFLRITDENSKLSLTHLIIFVSIYKIIIAPVFTITEVTALIVAMTSYSFKKHLMKNKMNLTDENKEAINKIEVNVNILADKLNKLADKQGIVAAAMGFKAK